MKPLLSDLPPAIEVRLQDGETIEWWGRPRQGVFVRQIDAVDPRDHHARFKAGGFGGGVGVHRFYA